MLPFVPDLTRNTPWLDDAIALLSGHVCDIFLKTDRARILATEGRFEVGVSRHKK